MEKGTLRRSTFEFSITKIRNNFYETVYELIKEEYEDLNDYFIPNSQIQNPFLYTLHKNKDYKLIYKIIKENEKELCKFFNQTKQFSILHMLALYDEKFSEKQKKIFKMVIENTHVIVKNKLNRSFLETAISQNSINLDFILGKPQSLNISSNRQLIQS